ncbi:helix-turn-helix domain-containing protein [Sinorhizobium chiapasense]|uniref:Helix-turn-helix domain-containing protein n=1 Tax=Sinorhizobium chiapasense TaxID=501572 RepID=A0ABZ2BE26_9HYPH
MPEHVKPTIDQFSYTPTQAALVLGRHRSSIYRMIKEGKLKTRETILGRVILRDEILRFLGLEPVPGGSVAMQMLSDAESRAAKAERELADLRTAIRNA